MFGNIGGHIGRNLWVWTGLGLVVAAGAVIVGGSAGKGHHYGDLASFALMVSGLALCVISQRGMPPAAVEDDAA